MNLSSGCLCCVTQRRLVGCGDGFIQSRLADTAGDRKRVELKIRSAAGGPPAYRCFSDSGWKMREPATCPMFSTSSEHCRPSPQERPNRVNPTEGRKRLLPRPARPREAVRLWFLLRPTPCVPALVPLNDQPSSRSTAAVHHLVDVPSSHLDRDELPRLNLKSHVLLGRRSKTS